MIGLRRRPSLQPNPAPRRPVRPSLEALESRCSPSTITLNVAYVANQQVTLSGMVVLGVADMRSGPVGGLTVQISGAATGTATTDPVGNYSVTLTASRLGQVQAKTSDGQSNTATATLTASTPVILNFGYVKEDNNFYVFSGQVIGDVTQGMAITFSGQSRAMQGKTCTVGPDGWFTITVQIAPTDLGTVGATATDWWGNNSELVSTLLS